jgi:hypothetical protein
VFVPLLALTACPVGGDHTDSGDGSSAAGFTACGGDPEGSWKPVRFELDDADAFVGQVLEPACENVPGNVHLDPDGSYEFGSDHSYRIDLSLDVDMDVTLDRACVQALTNGELSTDDSGCAMLEDILEQQLGLKAASCGVSELACDCSLSSSIESRTDTTYDVQGKQLVITTDSGDLHASDFCVAGDRLEVKVESGTLAGLVVLER